MRRFILLFAVGYATAQFGRGSRYGDSGPYGGAGGEAVFESRTGRFDGGPVGFGRGRFPDGPGPYRGAQREYGEGAGGFPDGLGPYRESPRGFGDGPGGYDGFSGGPRGFRDEHQHGPDYNSGPYGAGGPSDFRGPETYGTGQGEFNHPVAGDPDHGGRIAEKILTSILG
ncbi:unnamed protein product [Caenorhabditis bovis]|uniref:Uncharacterized protein n=1 Tax=Caenorhabditis bovis TaxID=2654633 RepID=A0A8S1E6Q6_9PELO|nr:unnamed protein product [Caenorhabditis bovis]